LPGLHFNCLSEMLVELVH